MKWEVAEVCTSVLMPNGTHTFIDISCSAGNYMWRLSSGERGTAFTLMDAKAEALRAVSKLKKEAKP